MSEHSYSLNINTGVYRPICHCTGKCENGTKTCSGGEKPKDRELRELREQVVELSRAFEQVNDELRIARSQLFEFGQLYLKKFGVETDD